MELKETVVMALWQVRVHKFRSFLTVLGIVVGVGCVIVVASLLTGMRGQIVSVIEEYGTNNIYAFHLSTGIQVGEPDRKERQRPPLTYEDGQIILRDATAVEAVASQLFVGFIDSTIVYEGESYRRGQLQGVTPNYAQVTNLQLQDGRFISEIDELYRRDVMVIGQNVAEALFPFKNDIVGTKVKMAGKTFEIIGVLEKAKSLVIDENQDNFALMLPFLTARKLSPGSEWMFLNIRARSGQLPIAYDQIEEILRRRRGVNWSEPNNFDLTTADKFIEQFDQITAAVGILAIAISGVGLLVGGIGVMNIMLVSVTERTQEIGVRKALGARRRDITRQFLFEAMTLTFLGGIVGVIIAAAISKIIMLLLPSLPASVPLWAVLAGLGVSTFIGLVFGVLPARKAAMLDPIEALRHD